MGYRATLFHTQTWKVGYTGLEPVTCYTGATCLWIGYMLYMLHACVTCLWTGYKCIYIYIAEVLNILMWRVSYWLEIIQFAINL